LMAGSHQRRCRCRNLLTLGYTECLCAGATCRPHSSPGVVRMAKVLRLERRRLDVDQLQLGMFVCELDCPWESTDFMFQGFLLDDRTTLEAVRERCRHVYVDDFRQVE